MDTPHNSHHGGIPDMGLSPWPTDARYPVNTSLRIHEHVPPGPFGHYGDSPRPPPDLSHREGKGWWELGRFDLALADPPLETSPPGPLERTLTVTGIKTLRTGGGAHVVTCFLDGNRATEYVAKIYDGLDYPLGTDSRDSHPDFMTRADQDYSIEAAAYRTMQPRIGGKGIVPAYYGSWTFPMRRTGPGHQQDGGREQARWVRMILMERIRGECMLTIMANAEARDGNSDHAPLPPEPFRLRVLQHVIEVFKFARWYGMVRHMDFAPRNFMVRPDGSVVLIDFNDSFSEELAAGGDSHPRLADPTMLPPSPIQESLHSVSSMVKRISPWYRWIPEGWRGDEDKLHEWLVETFWDDARFAPVDETWLNSTYNKTWCSESILRLLESLGRKPAEGSELDQGAAS